MSSPSVSGKGVNADGWVAAALANPVEDVCICSALVSTKQLLPFERALPLQFYTRLLGYPAQYSSALSLPDILDGRCGAGGGPVTGRAAAEALQICAT